MGLTRERRKVLVTGGAGFIGSHVVDRLVADGCWVRVVDNLSTGRLQNITGHLERDKVDFVEGDVRDASVVEKSVEDVDVVVHLAAVTSVPFSVENPSFTFDVNVAGTLNLLRSCAEKKVGRFVFASSCAVYGEPKFLPLSEGHPTNPISPYAESKLAGEKFCLGFHEKKLLRSVVLRLFNVYGPRQGVNDYYGVITRFIERGRRGLPLVIYGDGWQTRDFVNIRDVVRAVSSAIESEYAEGNVFNIGSGKPTSVRELAEAVLESAGLDLQILNEEPRLGEIRHSYADISKAEKLLRYRPKVSLKDGLRALLANENEVNR
jgi:UDP-glucose 4-epimerase